MGKLGKDGIERDGKGDGKEGWNRKGEVKVKGVNKKRRKESEKE